MSATMERMAISGLDCAGCASSLEAELRALAGLESVTVNFATGSVSYPAGRRRDVERIVRAARVEIDSAGIGAERNTDEHGASNAARLAVIGFAALVFVGLLGLHDRMHAAGLWWLEWPLASAAWLAAGWNVLGKAWSNLGRGRVFDENFLMTIATLGAFAVHQLPEAVGVMLFYAIGEWFQERAVSGSRRAINALVNNRPDTARIIAMDGTRIVAASTVAVGSLVEVRPGERIALDGTVVDGSAWIDTSSLTGEAEPRRFESGMDVSAGFLVSDAVLVLRTTARVEDSAASRILRLVEDAAGRKAPAEKLVTRLAAVYTPLVVGGAVLLAVLPPLFGAAGAWDEWLYRALVFLVISCPCALVVSIPLGYFGGIGAASKKGILVKGGEYLDRLGRLKTVVFDKSGTLTDGRFSVGTIQAVPDFGADRVLALAAALEAGSNHPLAAAVRAAAGQRGLAAESVREVTEQRGHGMAGVLADGTPVLAGNDRLLKISGVVLDPALTLEPGPGAWVHVACGGRHVGSLAVSDRIKETAAAGVAGLRARGVRTFRILTGDREEAARDVAMSLGIAAYDAGLRPEDKLAVLETMLRGSAERPLAFVGDGINDAPVLRRADVGVAMGGIGSDAAVEAADVVLMGDDPGRLVDAVYIGQRTRKIIFQNIALALVVKGLFLTLGGFGMADLWEAIIADVGVALLAILNSMRVYRGI